MTSARLRAWFTWSKQNWSNTEKKGGLPPGACRALSRRIGTYRVAKIGKSLSAENP